MFGTVDSISPLKIQIEQRLTLTEKDLILTRNVLDHWVDTESNHFTMDSPLVGYSPWDTSHVHPPSTAIGTLNMNHRHQYQGRKKIMIYNGLLPGEKVILIRLQGGQRYVVLDRINDHTVEGEWG